MEEEAQNSYQDTVKHQSFGAIIAIVVVLSMIVIGAFYVFEKHAERGQYVTQQTTATTTR